MCVCVCVCVCVCACNIYTYVGEIEATESSTVMRTIQQIKGTYTSHIYI